MKLVSAYEALFPHIGSGIRFDGKCEEPDSESGPTCLCNSCCYFIALDQLRTQRLVVVDPNYIDPEVKQAINDGKQVAIVTDGQYQSALATMLRRRFPVVNLFNMTDDFRVKSPKIYWQKMEAWRHGEIQIIICNYYRIIDGIDLSTAKDLLIYYCRVEKSYPIDVAQLRQMLWRFARVNQHNVNPLAPKYDIRIINVPSAELDKAPNGANIDVAVRHIVESLGVSMEFSKYPNPFSAYAEFQANRSQELTSQN